MGIFKKALVAAVGAVASYYAAKYTKQLLEEKPLKTRASEAKGKVVQLKAGIKSKLNDLAKKGSALVEKDDSPAGGPDDEPKE